MSKPSYPGWIPDNSTNIVAPTGGQVTAGWLPLQKPPSQYFNWFFNLVSQWVNFTGPGAPTVIVGSAAYCTHATLAAAVADSGIGANIRVLLAESQTLANAAVNLTKAGWYIDTLPGVTYTGGGSSSALNLEAPRITVRGLRLSTFTTAITFNGAADYARLKDLNFSACTTAIDTSGAPLGNSFPLEEGTINE